jgi:hypothetical protein
VNHLRLSSGKSSPFSQPPYSSALQHYSEQKKESKSAQANKMARKKENRNKMASLIRLLAVSTRKTKVLAESGDFHWWLKQKSSDFSLLFLLRQVVVTRLSSLLSARSLR